jgi:hypothetical protein
MKRTVLAAVVAGTMYGWTLTSVRAQGAAAGDVAALEKERTAVDEEFRAVDQKRTELLKAIEASPALVELKKTSDTAESAYQDFVKNNPDYVRFLKARDESGAAYRKALEDAKAADAGYLANRKQRDELRAKKSELDKKVAAAKAAAK